MEKNKQFLKKLFKNKATPTYLLVLVVYIICEILLKTGNMSSLFKNLLVPCTCYIVAALALNLLSLGHAGFMSIGAFSAVCVSGILSSTITNGLIRLIIAIIIGALISAIFGFLIGIPVLKLEGDYLAIVTLAFCQIIVSLINNIYLGYDSLIIEFPGEKINDILLISNPLEIIRNDNNEFILSRRCNGLRMDDKRSDST